MRVFFAILRITPIICLHSINLYNGDAMFSEKYKFMFKYYFDQNFKEMFFRELIVLTSSE